MVAAMSVLAAACNSKSVYCEYRNVPLSGWDKDSTLVFEVPVSDSLATYEVVLSVRHNQNYPYQNLWLFVENGQSGQTDTLEYYLADQRGRWLGNGFGDKREMPCLIAEKVRFARTGTYVYKVKHGMREDVLNGVTEVGLQIDRQ